MVCSRGGCGAGDREVDARLSSWVATNTNAKDGIFACQQQLGVSKEVGKGLGLEWVGMRKDADGGGEQR
jgi:hypothetical protein